MTLLSLDVRDFRCIQRVELELDAQCTLITGANASGKTSLLEAIHVLSCGHSFRTNHQQFLIRHGSASFITVGRVKRQGQTVVLGVQSTPDKTDAHIGGKQVHGFAQLASMLPTQVIDPEVHRLIEDGPKERRRFLDWGVFHVEPQFVESWRKYQRALRQRNAALKAKLPRNDVVIWDSELAGAGMLVASQRQRYVDTLQGSIAELAGVLLDLKVRVEHRRGWNEDEGLEKMLVDSWFKDQRQGTTTYGPHRADLAIYVEGAPARERISRGQQKLLASAMLLAQLSQRVEIGAEPATLLLDDPAAELDVDNLRKLLVAVSKVSAQLVVTSLDLKSIDGYLSGRRFHVKQGNATPVL